MTTRGMGGWARRPGIRGDRKRAQEDCLGPREATGRLVSLSSCSRDSCERCQPSSSQEAKEKLTSSMPVPIMSVEIAFWISFCVSTSCPSLSVMVSTLDTML